MVDSAADSSGNTLTATVSNKRLLNRLRGFIRTERPIRRLGDEACTSGLAAQKHLLRPLFTADGVISNGALEIGSENLELLQDVQLLLLGFGVQSAIIESDVFSATGPVRTHGSPLRNSRNSEGGAFASGGLSDRRVSNNDVPG